MSMQMRTPLSRAKGLGSAKQGSHHWWLQRVTAIALIPLVLWFVFCVVGLVGAGYEEAVAWVASPFNTVLLIAFLWAMFYHLSLGLQVVIEDYVHQEMVKISALIIMKLAAALLGLAGAVAVLRIALGA